MIKSICQMLDSRTNTDFHSAEIFEIYIEFPDQVGRANVRVGSKVMESILTMRRATLPLIGQKSLALNIPVLFCSWRM